MRIRTLFPAALICLATFAAVQRGPAPPRLVLSSTAWIDGAKLPEKYAGMGGSPPLEWTNVPNNTMSFALILHDGNGAPQATSWDPVHWMLWNIPAVTRKLAENAPAGMKLPDGTNQGKNFGGTFAYRGSNPPPGDVHHMIFDFYALDQQLDLSPDATRADLMKAMDGHVIGRTVLIATYQK